MNLSKIVTAPAFAILLSAALSTQAMADDVTRQIRVTDKFEEGRIGSDVGADRIDFLFNLIVVNNTIELCGVYAVGAGAPGSFNGFLRDSGFKINGRRVIKGLKYWNRVDRSELRTAMANCRSTGIPANAKIDSLDFAWSRRAYNM
jgi:hypothetical protein